MNCSFLRLLERVGAYATGDTVCLPCRETERRRGGRRTTHTHTYHPYIHTPFCDSDDCPRDTQKRTDPSNRRRSERLNSITSQSSDNTCRSNTSQQFFSPHTSSPPLCCFFSQNVLGRWGKPVPLTTSHRQRPSAGRARETCAIQMKVASPSLLTNWFCYLFVSNR
jgi:hypothetical protein